LCGRSDKGLATAGMTVPVASRLPNLLERRHPGLSRRSTLDDTSREAVRVGRPRVSRLRE
ncbi:MAG: hypothetical protein AB7F89_26750, partial [Pirellulaceae bacterium]